MMLLTALSLGSAKAQSVCTGLGISVHVINGDTPANQVCDCYELSVKVKNLQSNARNFDVRIVFPQNYLSPCDDETDDFAETLEIGDDYVYRSQNVAFAANEEREFKFKLRAVLFAGFPLNYTGIANESGNPSLCSEGEEVITDVIRTVDAGQNPPSPLSDFYGFTGSPLQDPVTACGPAVQEFILSGTLDVDEDYCIWGLNNLRSKIYMEPDAAIIVRSGVRLLLQYVDIVGCDEMWDRIKVESGGELIVENAYFQDGQYAIWLEPGAKLSLKYSKFTNNRVGVYIPNTYSTPLQTTVEILSFYGNVFEGTAGGLKPPYAGQQAYCGVEAHDLKTLSIVGVHAENAAYNFFENMTYGIIAENTNMVVRYCHFEDIEAQSGTGGYGIYTTSPLNYSRTLEQSGFGTSSDLGFVNCDVGIYGEVTRMNITRNHMQDMGRGVVALRSRRVQVKNNVISSRNNGISLVQNSPCKCEIENNELYIDDDDTVPTAHGIRSDETLYGVPGDVYRIRNNYVELENAVGGIAAQSGRYLKLENNTVFMSDNISYTGIGLYASRQAAGNCNVVDGPTTGSFTDTRGFYVNASAYPELGCNEVNATEYGVQFFGLNNGTALRGNTFGTHFYGLVVGQPLPNNTGITASIGTQSHHGNIWSQAAAGQGLQAFLVNPTSFSVLQSQFIVDCEEGDNNQLNFCPSNNAVGTEWFFDEGTPNSSYYCSTANACPQGVGYGGFIKQPDELDKRLAEGNFTASDYEGNQLWMGQSHLYARVSDGIVEVAPNSEIDSFVSANYNTTIGQFYRLEKSIAELLVPDNAVDSLIYTYDQTVAGYLHNMAVLDSLVFHAASSNDSLAYLEEKLATADTLAGVLALSDTLSAVTYADLLLIADSLQTRNQAIQTSEIYEENWKQVHHIFLETVAIGDLSLSDGQKDTLAAIAGQCPLEGGEAVFAARALYELKMGNQLYDDSLLCAATRSLQRPNNPDPRHVPYIYPNPNASGLVVVEIPGLKRDDLTAMVYNQYGVLVSTIPLQGSGDRYLLEVESQVPGVYFIQIRTQQEVLPATRFILAK